MRILLEIVRSRCGTILLNWPGFAGNPKNEKKKDRCEKCVKVFQRFVGDKVRFVRCDPGILLEEANNFHPNVQLIKDKLVFLLWPLWFSSQTWNHICNSYMGWSKDPRAPVSLLIL